MLYIESMQFVQLNKGTYYAYVHIFPVTIHCT